MYAMLGSSCTAWQPTARPLSSFSNPSGSWAPWSIFSAKSGSGGPITVRLDPCGKAKARLVDPAGKPIAGHRDPYLIGMVVTPGPSWLSRDQGDEGRLEADQDYLCRIDRINYLDGSISDTHGT